MRKRLKILLCSLTFLAILYLAQLPHHTKAERTLPDLIEVSIATLLDTGDGSIVLLKENQGDRFLPISIGDPETRAIALGLERQRRPQTAPRLDRPLTHNLALDIMAKLGGRLDHIAVSDMRGNIFYADVYLKVSGNRELKIDARPSDAIALAVTLEKPVPIYVTRDLMARSGKKAPQLLEPAPAERKKALRL